MSQEDERSVRAVAKAAGLRPNVFQNLRSGKTIDIKLVRATLSQFVVLSTRVTGEVTGTQVESGDCRIF